MNTIAIWYLILSFYRGGTVAIPQESKEQCLSNARWEQNYNYNHSLTNSPSAQCIPGILGSNETTTRH